LRFSSARHVAQPALDGRPSQPRATGLDHPWSVARDRPATERWCWTLTILVVVGTSVFRGLDPYFANDHFSWILGGRYIVAHSQIPIRDFSDSGYFAQYFASAAAQAVFGYSLLGEALLAILLLSLGHGLTFWLASKISRSLLIGLIVTAFAVALYPRLYNYPKIFLFALGLLLGWRYVDRPTPGWLATLGIFTGLAFLLRHDYAVYIAASVGATFAAVHWRPRLTFLFRRALIYMATAALPVLPFLVFLQANGGVVDYFSSSIYWASDHSSIYDIPPDFVIDWSAPLLVVGPPPTPPPASIKVRWRDELPERARREAEAEYQLAHGQLDGEPAENTWRYDLSDSSTENVEALVGDRRVEDTGGIDRETYEIDERPSEPAGAQLQRALGVPTVEISPGVLQPANAKAWLYHLLVGLPVIGLVLLGPRLGRAASSSPGVATPKIVMPVALSAIATPLLLRQPLEGRFADIGAPAAILAAWLLAELLHRRGGRRGNGVRRRLRHTISTAARFGIALTLLLATGASVATMAEGGNWLERRGVLDGPEAVIQRAGDVLQQLSATPPSEEVYPAGRGWQIARYVNACTQPSDPLLLTWFAPELYFFADRTAAGGQIKPEVTTIDRVRFEGVPLVITTPEREDHFRSTVPLIEDELARRYHLIFESSLGGDQVFRIFANNALRPTSTYAPLGLPCYR
jgi:hypothetical protein